MEWIVKQHARVLSGGSDVSINLVTADFKPSRVSITFRNNVYLKITKNNFLVCGLQGTRMYFKAAAPAEGFKLSTFNKDKSSCIIRVQERQLPISKNKIEIGDYKLEFDSNLKLYYIDAAHKITY